MDSHQFPSSWPRPPVGSRFARCGNMLPARSLLPDNRPDGGRGSSGLLPVQAEGGAESAAGFIGKLRGLRGDAIDLFERRDARLDLLDAVDPQGLHPALAGDVAELVERCAGADLVLGLVVRDEQLVDADPAGEAEVAAAWAAAGLEELFDVAGDLLDLPALVDRRLVRLLARLA